MPTRQLSQLEAFLVLRRNPLELWGKPAYERPILSGRFFGREQLLLNDPTAIRHVLVANHENYRRNVGTWRVLQPLLGRGLFLAEGAPWRFQRRTIAPALAPRTLPILARHVVAASEAKEAELARLKQEHRDLDMAIDALESMVAGDQLQVQRLKKRKLSLKDQIIRLEDQLTPDIIA